MTNIDKETPQATGALSDALFNALGLPEVLARSVLIGALARGTLSTLYSKKLLDKGEVQAILEDAERVSEEVLATFVPFAATEEHREVRKRFKETVAILMQKWNEQIFDGKA